ALRRARLPSKAAATLRQGIARVPESVELREVLCDVLLETGHAREGVAEMLELAGLQIERLDAEQAVRTLQDILAIEPHNERPTQTLRELGYELVEEPAETTDTTAVSAAPDAPLPSYALPDSPSEPAAQLVRSEPSAEAARPAQPESPPQRV